MARREVVAKRGCTCCGTGCVIPAAIMPILSLGLSGMVGWMVAAVIALPAWLAGMHLLAWVDRRR